MRRFEQVNVFSEEPLLGNPVAVVLDADDLSAEQMAEFTRWTNLSEATFLLPPTTPEADYRLRIFYPGGELDFAGHPTLGTCHAWLGAGGCPRTEDVIVQECPAGLVRIKRDEGRLAFEAPALQRSGPVDAADLQRIGGILGVAVSDFVDSQWVDNGPGWVAVLLGSAEHVLALRPSIDDGPRVDIGVVGPYPAGSECAYEVRGLFSDDRGHLLEDPVTGSLNASVAQWLVGSGRVEAPYTASQGTKLSRRGRAHIEADSDGTIWVGGVTKTVIEGRVALA